MIFWDIANTLGRLLLAIIVIVKVTRFALTLNPVERVGLGFMGGGSLLTIPLIWEPEGPYQGWAVSILTYGAILFLFGRTLRDWKHARNNDRQVEQYRRDIAARRTL